MQACPTATLIENTVSRTASPSIPWSRPAPIAASAVRSRRKCRATSCAHGPLQAGPGQRGPFLRQGPLRLGLCDPQGPHHQADDPRARSPIPGARCRWDEAIAHAAAEFKRIQAKYGRESVGAITSSRCTNEEVFVVQKLVRAALRQQQCRHLRPRLPFADRLWPQRRRFGTSAGTQDFKSVDKADVMLVIGANPTDGHPVFASRMKKRLRAGRQADRRRSARASIWCARRMSQAAHHLKLRPGTNVALLNALAHVIVTEGLVDEAYRARALRSRRVREPGRASSRWSSNSPEATEASPAFRRPTCAPPRGSTPPAAMARSITASASPSTARARPR